MKSDKVRPMTDRQKRQAEKLGLKLPDDTTVHAANKIICLELALRRRKDSKP